MNRLTKHISLVLISSSLVLHGCFEPTRQDEDKDRQTPGGSSGGHSHAGGLHSGWYGRSGSGSSGWIGGSRSSSSGVRSTSSIGGSSRGGFGASAHGVSS